jgi:hypothetical protein
MAMQIAATSNMRQAFQFAIGVVVVEIIYILLTMRLASYALASTKFKRGLTIGSQLFFLGFAIYYLVIFFTNSDTAIKGVAIPFSNTGLSGMFLSSINMLQIPFWLGWVIQFSNQGILNVQGKPNIGFAVCAGIGTLTALSIFIVAGNALQPWFSALNKYMSLVLAGLFTLAFITAYRQQSR